MCQPGHTLNKLRCPKPKFPCLFSKRCYSLSGTLLEDPLHDIGVLFSDYVDAAGNMLGVPPVAGGGGGRSKEQLEHDIDLYRLQLSAPSGREGSPQQNLLRAKKELRGIRRRERASVELLRACDWLPTTCGATSQLRPRQFDRGRFIDGIVDEVVEKLSYVSTGALALRDVATVVTEAHMSAASAALPPQVVSQLCSARDSLKKCYRRLTRKKHRKPRKRRRTRSAPPKLGRRRTRRTRRRYHSGPP